MFLFLILLLLLLLLLLLCVILRVLLRVLLLLLLPLLLRVLLLLLSSPRSRLSTLSRWSTRWRTSSSPVLIACHTAFPATYKTDQTTLVWCSSRGHCHSIILLYVDFVPHEHCRDGSRYFDIIFWSSFV